MKLKIITSNFKGKKLTSQLFEFKKTHEQFFFDRINSLGVLKHDQQKVFEKKNFNSKVTKYIASKLPWHFDKPKPIWEKRINR